NAHVRVVNKPVDEEDDVQPKKPKGMMVFDKTSFVAEGSTGDLSVNDPSFWEKVLGHISVEMLSKKLEDGSALASRQTKAKFMAQLQQALGQLIQDVRENKKEKDAFFQHEYEVAVNMLQRLAAIKDQFSSDQRKLKISRSKASAVEFEGAGGDVCTLCGEGGVLLLCDGACHRSFHLDCVGLTDEPTDAKWLCPDCSAGKHRCLACGKVGKMGSEQGI
ncbi:hypothetical protein DYB25_014156, partial [Aphanomyces astaci]